MLIKAILVALLATGSQWWFSCLITRTWPYPIWSGFLTGVIIGEPALSMQVAAYTQLTYLGWIIAGGSMPGNPMVAGIYGTALTVLSGADPKLAVSFVVILPLLGTLINQAYMILNSVWVHRAGKYPEERDPKGVRLMNYVPSGILSFVLYGIPAMLVILYRAQRAQDTPVMTPQWLVDALSPVGAIMSVLGIVMLLGYLGRKKLIAFFSFGFSAMVYLKLDTMSLFVFPVVIAAVMYLLSRDREERGA